MLVLKHSKDACAGFFGISLSFRVHPPFYDGNGRTGRYLLALYLDESLSIPTVLSLSRTIAENKNAYYAAFSSVKNPLNHGEMAHFVYAMLELIRTAQSSMIERLQNSIEHFEAVQQNCREFCAKQFI